MAQYIDEYEPNRLAATGTLGYASAKGAGGVSSLLALYKLL